MLQKLLQGIAGQKAADRDNELYQNLIRHEAQIGAGVFGPIPAGHRREFFCLDEHTWVWHEEWRDHYGQPQMRVTRYDIRPDGLLKSQNGHYQRVGAQETRRFKQAARLYIDRVNREMYNGMIA